MQTISSTQPGSTQPGPAEIRARLRAMWASVADGWAEHADYTDRRAADLTRLMLQRTDPQPGERVLELASGPGGTGLAAAELVGPDGEVVVSDVVPAMTAIASARAAARGLVNVRTRELDLHEIDEPSKSFDVVLCREGLMFATDPAHATSEIRRVLRPGGRVAIAVWGPRERNPWLALVLDAVSGQTGQPVPPPGMPGPFSLDDADRLAGLLSRAGLVDVEVTDVPVLTRAASFEEWWVRTAALAGPLSKMLESLPSPVLLAIEDQLRSATSTFQTPAGLELPGLALLATAKRNTA